MRPLPEKEDFSNDFLKLINIIHDKHGLDFSNYAAGSFKRRIERCLALRQIPSIENLSQKILNDEFDKATILKEVTVNVTEMFRDPLFWIGLRTVFSEILRRSDRVRIWHAGCATGEEVYSMCIMLKEEGWWHKAELLATDISDMAIASARSGNISLKDMEQYTKNFNKVYPKGHFEKYFSFNDKVATFDGSLLSKVRFKNVDLVKTKVFDCFDLILCRNVLIYFDQKLQARVIGLFHKSLSKDAILALGNIESLSWNTTSHCFQPVNELMRIYQKVSGLYS